VRPHFDEARRRKGDGPRERDAEVGEAQLEELELAEVLVEEVAGRGVRACRAAEGVLASAIQGGDLVGVGVGRLGVGLVDDGAEGRGKVDILGGLLGDCRGREEEGQPGSRATRRGGEATTARERWDALKMSGDGRAMLGE